MVCNPVLSPGTGEVAAEVEILFFTHFARDVYEMLLRDTTWRHATTMSRLTRTK